MKKLSLFVDESGDFGAYSPHSPYYIVTMLLHDQSKNLSSDIAKLDLELTNLGYPHHAVHTEPLIRREEDYQTLPPNERRSIFSKLYYFTIKSEIQYKAFLFLKKEFETPAKLEERMAREISLFIRENLTYFQKYEKVILYYDNGQHELNQILHTVLSTELVSFETRRVLPSNYRLFQAADLICTLELPRLKLKTKTMTRSEKLIFHSPRDLNKDFLRGIQKKSFDSIYQSF